MIFGPKKTTEVNVISFENLSCAFLRLFRTPVNPDAPIPSASGFGRG